MKRPSSPRYPSPVLLVAVLVLAAGSASPSLAAKMIAAEPTMSPAPVARVAFRDVNGMVMVPVRVNGSRELEMILDTGMSSPIVLLMHRELGRELGLEGGQRAQIGGAGGQKPPEGWIFHGVTASLGGIVQPGLPAVVMDEARDSSVWTQDGVIGKSLFDRYVVDLDFERKVLSFYEPGTFASRGFESIPLTLNRGMPSVEARVGTGAGEEVPVRLVVDLGARHALSLQPDSAKRVGLPAKTIETVIGMGVQGDLKGRVGRVRSLRLGPFVLPGVLTTFADPESGSRHTNPGGGTDGNLGNGILRRFRVVLDYPHQRILLAPRPGYDRPFEQNMAGLVLRPRRDGSLAVRSVVAGSPAAVAGIAPGDRVLAIDGRKLGRGGVEDVTELFLKEGATLRLTVERDGTRSERSVTLRRLI